MKFKEASWKSFIVTTNTPIFTHEECDEIIKTGRQCLKIKGTVFEQKSIENIRDSNISWIPFEKLKPMYDRLNDVVHQINNNFFGFEGIQINELAQYTEYDPGGFYDWHVDMSLDGKKHPPIRKISMSVLLSNENEFEGGDLEIMDTGRKAKLIRGQALFFASFIRHRVSPVIKGNRKSLVVWFGGPAFK